MQLKSIFTIIVMSLFLSVKLAAQSSNNYMRIAKIVVDSTQLDKYILALKEQMKTALKSEKGVLAYSAVQDKNNPAHITILETYASTEAYQKHTQAPHFKKYKAMVENMVKSLELIEVLPIAIGNKRKVVLY
jgi:quinol monooxygenase YgiN